MSCNVKSSLVASMMPETIDIGYRVFVSGGGEKVVLGRDQSRTLIEER
jgi:hypothetical protein